VDQKAIEDLFEWLVDGAPGSPNPVVLLEKLLPALASAGVGIARAEALVRTLHPHIAGRRFSWERGGAVAVSEETYAHLNSPEFMESPVGRVFQSGEPIHSKGYAAFPFRFTNGEIHAITFSTPSDFSTEERAALARVVRPLGRIAEIFARARTAANLLSTYVGRDAGGRILSGHIQRGDTETIRCAIWFSDLRGFTSISQSKDPGAIIRLLNDLFECQVPAIERHGGEVLKFMGDGLLGIFAIDDKRSEKEACEAALRASADATAALEEHNRKTSSDMKFGLALHVGEVAYGNIGGSSRLDFTCIGPAVNLASRIEGLTGKLGRPMLMSDAFAVALARATREVGTFEVKGVTAPQRVYELCP
jgi:adenylate cyclase